MLGAALSTARLARWLGPWADPTRAPFVRTEQATVEHLTVRVYHPRGRTPRATYLIAPGLHYAGPDDPRMDRFCRILAAAGQLVIAPFFVGESLAPRFVGAGTFPWTAHRRARLAEARQIADVVLLRYALSDRFDGSGA